jgi:hypothetical protein
MYKDWLLLELCAPELRSDPLLVSKDYSVDTQNRSVASPATPRDRVSRNGKLPTYYIGG